MKVEDYQGTGQGRLGWQVKELELDLGVLGTRLCMLSSKHPAQTCHLEEITLAVKYILGLRPAK